MKYELTIKSIATLSDDELLRGLSKLLQQSRRIEAELVAHIGEVEARRLFAREATSSMYSYCTEVLHLSEHEAYLRIEAARASRKHPVLLEMLADGRLHLSAISILRPHLTEANRETVLKRATHKSKRQVQEIVAELSPKADTPAMIRKLPERQVRAEPSRTRQLGPGLVPTLSSNFGQSQSDVETTFPNPALTVPTKPAVVEPIAPARYRVEFTASVALRDKLERLKALMRSSVPDGDLADIIEKAVTEKLERLESKRFGKTKAPRKNLKETDRSPSSRYIPAAVKRAVYDRDQGQCSFVGDNGRRCTERSRLEFHHRHPYGRGGGHKVKNVTLLCRAHNGYLAERDYGKDVMGRYRRSDGRVSESAVFYTIGNRVNDLLGLDLVQPKGDPTKKLPARLGIVRSFQRPPQQIGPL